MPFSYQPGNWQAVLQQAVRAQQTDGAQLQPSMPPAVETQTADPPQQLASDAVQGQQFLPQQMMFMMPQQYWNQQQGSGQQQQQQQQQQQHQQFPQMPYYAPQYAQPTFYPAPPQQQQQPQQHVPPQMQMQPQQYMNLGPMQFMPPGAYFSAPPAIAAPHLAPPVVPGAALPALAVPKRRRKRRKSNRCSSTYRGVSWHKRDHRWVARAWVNGKTENLGTFVSEKQAALMVDAKLAQAYGPASEALLNFSDPAERAEATREVERELKEELRREREERDAERRGQRAPPRPVPAHVQQQQEARAQQKQLQQVGGGSSGASSGSESDVESNEEDAGATAERRETGASPAGSGSCDSDAQYSDTASGLAAHTAAKRRRLESASGAEAREAPRSSTSSSSNSTDEDGDDAAPAELPHKVGSVVASTADSPVQQQASA